MSDRNLLGEDLGSLDGKELENLELQLESSLKHIRSTKVTSEKRDGNQKGSSHES